MYHRWSGSAPNCGKPEGCICGKKKHTFHIINGYICWMRKDSDFYIVSFRHLCGKLSCQL